MKIMRKIIEIDEKLCNGCGQCVPGCAEGALTIVDGKARLIAEKYCDGLGACLGDCPTGALQVVEREAEDFDEAAVEELLRQRQAAPAGATTPAGGCPSARLQSFAVAAGPCEAANQPTAFGQPAQAATLSHWPIQIRLVPATAPFLQNADLLVAADCTPVACPTFQRDLLAGRKILLGCPKFDDPEGYVRKFTEIFASVPLNSITIAIMEVPCCASMRAIVQEAMRRAGKDLPMEEVVIGCRGQILRQGRIAA